MIKKWAIDELPPNVKEFSQFDVIHDQPGFVFVKINLNYGGAAIEKWVDRGDIYDTELGALKALKIKLERCLKDIKDRINNMDKKIEE